jgi:hypothetical protein
VPHWHLRSWESIFPICFMGWWETFIPSFHFATLSMGNNTWVLPSFKQILIDASDEYMKNTDKEKGKPRTALIARVADEIRQVVDDTNDKLPDDLHKVCFILLYISASLNPDVNVSGYPHMVRKRGSRICQRRWRKEIESGYTWPSNLLQVMDRTVRLW